MWLSDLAQHYTKDDDDDDYCVTWKIILISKWVTHISEYNYSIMLLSVMNIH